MPLDEAAHERAVLVERRPAALAVLLEGERQLLPVLELAAEHDKGAEDEVAEGRVEVRSSDRHGTAYALGGSSPLWQAGHQ